MNSVLDGGCCISRHMQSFAMTDAKLYNSQCKALRWQMQSFNQKRTILPNIVRNLAKARPTKFMQE